MSRQFDVNIAVYNLADTANDWQGDAKIGHVLKAPSATQGGGLTILKAYAVNQAATGAGTSFALQLLNYGTGGTSQDSVISSALGGTASPWAAGTPKEFTISDGYIAPGEWVVLKKTETNSSDPSRCSVIIEYVMGK